MGELMIKGSCTNENLDFFAFGTPLDLMKLVTETLWKICGEWNFHWKCDLVAHPLCPSCIFTQTLVLEINPRWVTLIYTPISLSKAYLSSL
jgi:hypothetical protein